MLRITDVTVDPKSVGEMLLCDVQPYYAYDANNNRTEKIMGHKCVVACTSHALRKLAVKIEGKVKPVDVGDEFKVVEFDNLQISAYSKDGFVHLAARADAVSVVEE